MTKPRRNPYTERGVSRIPCIKCGKSSKFNWRFCADGGWRGVCVECDIELNAIAMRWAFGDTCEADIAAYAARARQKPY